MEIWNDAKSLAIEVYKITNQLTFMQDLSLKDQIRRAAVSIPSNIAEGDERGTDKESIRFLYIAKGSLAELITQLEIANEVGYINNDELSYLNDKCSIIGKRLGTLIKARSHSLLPIACNLTA